MLEAIRAVIRRADHQYTIHAQGRLHGAELVTHEFPLEDIAEAFRVMRERIDDPIKIVIIP